VRFGEVSAKPTSGGKSLILERQRKAATAFVVAGLEAWAIVFKAEDRGAGVVFSLYSAR